MVTGTGGGVGQSIIKALRLSKIDCRIVAADMNPLAAGIYRCDCGYLLPSANSPGFIDAVIDICRKEAISLLLIGSDPELPPIANYRRRIEEETGATVVVSSPEVVEIGYDKWKTYEFLRKNGFRCPRSALPDTMTHLVSEVGFPLIVKPRTGSASRDVYLAKNEKELDVFVKRVDNAIVQEYLEPATEEYTSGVIVFGGEVLGAITIKREIKGGASYRMIIDDYDIVKGAAIDIAKKLNPFGPCNFQTRVTEKGVTTFEINTRFSGTTAIRAAFGFNEPAAVIKYVLYHETPILNYSKGIAMRYWNEVYISFDEHSKLEKERMTENPSSKTLDYF
jgi:carbamoyl-phosphate synthase large subunit